MTIFDCKFECPPPKEDNYKLAIVELYVAFFEKQSCTLRADEIRNVY